MARRYIRKSELAERMRVLSIFDRRECIDEWREVFGRSPPKYLSIRFMRRVLLHDLQVRVLGAYPTKMRRALARLDREAASPTSRTDVPKGTVLLREWNGRTYRVEAVEDGFVMDDKTYRSLSAVAKRITGTKWSGARFFGLNKPQSKETVDA